MERAFSPTGLTQVVLATTTKPSPIQVKTDVTDGQQYRIYNSSSVPVFICLAPTSQEVVDGLTIPLAGSPHGAWPVAAGSVEIFSSSDDAYFGAITVSGTGLVYVTAGRGL